MRQPRSATHAQPSTGPPKATRSAPSSSGAISTSSSRRPHWSGTAQPSHAAAHWHAHAWLAMPQRSPPGTAERGAAEMATRADFTDDEWATLLRAPTLAGMAITFADPGGPIEVVKETSAVLKVVSGSSGEDRTDVVGEIARDVLAHAKERKNPVGDFKPKGALAGKEIIDELARANE